MSFPMYNYRHARIIGSDDFATFSGPIIAPKPAPAFKPGDRVRFCGSLVEWNGRTGTVSDPPTFGQSTRVTWDDTHYTVSALTYNLEPVPFTREEIIAKLKAHVAPKPRAFKVGDWVRAEGDPAQITHDDGDPEDVSPYTVEFLDGSDDIFNADELTKWAPKVGDRVVADEGDGAGTVKSTATEYPDYFVTWDDADAANIDGPWALEELSPTNIPAPSPFKVNDIVEATNGPFFSCVGIVTATTANATSLALHTEGGEIVGVIFTEAARDLKLAA